MSAVKHGGRILVAALSLSAAAFISLTEEEGYTDHAVIPVKGDRPTVGFGSTFHENGEPVKLGDKTTPVRALIKAKAHIDKEETIFRKSIDGVELHQGEYDLYMNWIYQYGTGAWSKPLSPRTWLLKGDYTGACDALLNWKYVGKFDCSTPGNKVCRGVWTRQLQRHSTCMSLQ